MTRSVINNIIVITLFVILFFVCIAIGVLLGELLTDWRILFDIDPRGSWFPALHTIFPAIVAALFFQYVAAKGIGRINDWLERR